MSDSDDLLEQLGALERQYDDAFPHEWEDVVRGDRTAAEVRAARAGIDDPDELEALAQVIRPLDAATRDAWVERLATSLRAPSHASPSHASPSAAADAEDLPAAEHGDPVSLDARRRARITWMTAAAGLLAAAALALWLRPHDGARPRGATMLPSFALTVRNETVHEIRSDLAPHDAVDRYQASSHILWVIRPERSVAPPLGLRVLAEPTEPSAAPTARRLIDPGDVQVSPQGVIELQGTIDDTLALPLGRWSLHLVVADPAVLPADLEAYDHGGPWTVSEPYVIDVIP